MKKNLTQKLTVFCFLAFIGVFSIWNLCAPKRTFSANENRTLAAAPSLSASHIFGGSFDTDFETWFSDHFVLRDHWIELKAAVRIASGAIENNGVYFAANGRLTSQFLTYTPEIAEQNVEMINEFSQQIQQPINVLLVPTAAYGEQASLPAGAYNVNQETLLEQIQQQLTGQNFIPIAERLKSGGNYYRTDHHWNQQGAYQGYLSIAENVLHQSPQTFTWQKAAADFCGTMYSKSGAFWLAGDDVYTITAANPVQVTVTYDNDASKTADTLYSPQRLSEKDKYEYYLDGNHPYVEIKTNAASDREAVIIKDSYAHILIPYLAQEYSRIQVVDLRYYRGPVSSLISDADQTDFYVIYSLDNFCTDTNLVFLR